MKLYLINVSELNYEAIQNRFLNRIKGDKRNRIHKLHVENDKVLTLISELLLYYALIKDYGFSSKELIFEKNEYGKPYLLKSQNVHFNLSHSNEWVACFINDSPVGVDIEQTDDIDNKLLYDITHANERAMMSNNKENFFSLWCLKESYTKFIGKGLYFDVKQLFFDFNIKHNIKLIYNNEIITNHFLLLDVIENYKLAVCCENIVIPKIEFVTYQDIEKCL
ncbi:4'-phosphopantetheinyl transferase family protein [Staphylococcus equorum]|uniref:4'-phosphopantetheinyl transferase family protein n=1 Tax=Staphylococcus equorum TaxID=246432 RepID=UPI003CE93DC8